MGHCDKEPHRHRARRNIKFKTAAGAIGKLKAGKVMLLQGADARLVSSVAHGKGTVVLVHTKPAVMTDVISSGHITFAGSPDFTKSIP